MGAWENWTVSPRLRGCFTQNRKQLKALSEGKLHSLGLRMSLSLAPILGEMVRRVKEAFQRWALNMRWTLLGLTSFFLLENEELIWDKLPVDVVSGVGETAWCGGSVRVAIIKKQKWDFAHQRIDKSKNGQRYAPQVFCPVFWVVSN